MKLKRALSATAGVALVGMMIAGCGGANQVASERGTGSTSKTSSEYVDVLLGFRDAAKAGKVYDAYGYAEYLPSTQRAAIDAFCFIADRIPENPEFEAFEGPSLTLRITRKAESDLKSERDIVAPRPARKAIRKLRSVLGLESLSADLARRYVRACYHTS